MPSDSALIGRTLARGLRILERLGSSPEGPLFQAKYPNGSEVTVLVLTLRAAPGEPSPRDLFVQASRIRHSNVAAVYEVGEMDDGTVYVVLEQVIGEPLSDTLAEGRVFELGDAIDLALQASAGLQAAYRAGFVHGSLSPRAIILTPMAHGRFLVKLTGFRPALASRQPEAQPPVLQEAAERYASPERLLGHSVDERSEVFSLGAVLHHLLTGMPPSQGRVGSSVRKAARAELEIALAQHPARRFQSLSELDDALRGVASTSGGHKRSTHQRLLRFGAVAVGLALVAGGIRQLPGSMWHATGGERSPIDTEAQALEGAERNSSSTPQGFPGTARAHLRAPAAAPEREGPPAPARGDSTQHATPSPSTPRPLPEPPRNQSTEAGRVATSPPEEAQAPRAGPGWAERFARVELAVQEIVRKLGVELPAAAERSDPTTDDQRADGPVSRSPGQPSKPKAPQAPSRAVVEKQENRRNAERPLQEPLGYVGEPVADSGPDSQSNSSPATDAATSRGARPIKSALDPRSRVELERDQSLRQSIGDVVRLGVAKDVSEIRPGSLRVSLTPEGMHVSSVLYNLQRLYLAYSAATAYHDEIQLELMQGNELYGRFTRRGLTRVNSK